MNDQPTLTPELEDADTFSEELLDNGRVIRLQCRVGDCSYSCRYGKGFEDHDYARETFRRTHTAQHAPGKTPDIQHLEVTYSGWCTNCGSHFEYDDYEGEGRIWCDECPASWTTEGWDGRTDLERPE